MRIRVYNRQNEIYLSNRYQKNIIYSILYIKIKTSILICIISKSSNMEKLKFLF